MRTILAALLLAIISTSSQAAQTPRPLVFGINIAQYNPTLLEREFQLAKEAGCTNVRVGVGWDLIEWQPGVYDWRLSDPPVDLCIKYGLEPIYLVCATPKHYLEDHMKDKPYAWPALPQYFPQAEKFYKALAERYKGKVKYFEFWNEQNGWSWHKFNSPEDYGPILKVAYKALKESNPDCIVAVGGLDGAGWKGYYHFVEKLYDLGYGDCFDAVGIHPYRADGPIDVQSIRKMHQILVEHGHGNRKLWITEYGWSKEPGHDIRARWTKETLDILTSPEFDYVFQASFHTLSDFDDAQYGMCNKELSPRPVYQVFKNYPKDWSEIEKLQKAPKPENKATVPLDDFEDGFNRWTSYGDGLNLRYAQSVNIKPESGRRLLVAATTDKPLKGGAYRTFDAIPGLPVIVDTRAYTNQSGSDAKNARLRVGIDPTGGKDPDSGSVAWGRWIDTSGEWDSAGLGLANRIIAKEKQITIFLDYAHTGGTVTQITAFDNIEITMQEETFKLPSSNL